MFFSIRYKVFLAILTANILLAGSMYFVSSWSFEKRFLDYINKVEFKRYEPLIRSLSKGYEKNGSWDWVSKDQRRLRNLIRQKLLPQIKLPPMENSDDRVQEKEVTPFGLGIILLDNDGNALIDGADNTDDKNIYPIKLHGRIIGAIGIERHRAFTEELDKVFAKQLNQSFIGIAIALIIISGLITLPLSSRLVKPIQRILRRTEQVAKGDYQIRLNHFANDEIGKLAESFNRMTVQLEEDLRLRQQWIADISHELRTPVSILKGEIEALLDGVRDFDDVSLSSLNQEVAQLTRLINDLHYLALSDLEQLDLNVEELDLPVIIDQVINKFSSSAKERSIRVSSNLEFSACRINGDRERLIQLFSNLMTNTLRYTIEGGMLDIRVAITDKEAMVIWQDSEPGVSEEEASKVFERLYRMESSRNRKSGGSGLGLSICKNIAIAHKAEIRAEPSTLGGLKVITIFKLA